MVEVEEILIDRFGYIRTLELNRGMPEDEKLPMPKVDSANLCAGSAQDIAGHFLMR